MAHALRAWAIKGRKKLGLEPAVRTSHSANKRYIPHGRANQIFEVHLVCVCLFFVVVVVVVLLLLLLLLLHLRLVFGRERIK